MSGKFAGCFRTLIYIQSSIFKEIGSSEKYKAKVTSTTTEYVIFTKPKGMSLKDPVSLETSVVLKFSVDT